MFAAMARTAACWAILAALAFSARPAAAQDAPLVVEPDEPLDIEIDGTMLAVSLHTGSINNLTLYPEATARLAIKPVPMFGNWRLSIGQTKVLSGRSRATRVILEGIPYRTRVVWLEGATGVTGDGTIGPLAIPADHVAIRLGGANTTVHSFPMLGVINSEVGTGFAHDGGKMRVVFAVEATGRYPIASAAAGADIAKAYAGVPTDDVWDEPIVFGIRRPVRLVRLGRPLVIGPFQFDAIAVRVRDRLDGAGSGDKLPEPPDPDADADRSEIIVTGPDKKGQRPIYSLTIGRPFLQQCGMLEYRKAAQEIRLSC